MTWFELYTEAVSVRKQHCGQDHRCVKRRVNPGLGFGSFRTAQRTLQGYEMMHMIRKGQLEGIAKGDVLAQNRVLAQVFGVAA
jgi:IS6 family transposase